MELTVWDAISPFLIHRIITGCCTPKQIVISICTLSVCPPTMNKWEHASCTIGIAAKGIGYKETKHVIVITGRIKTTFSLFFFRFGSSQIGTIPIKLRWLRGTCITAELSSRAVARNTCYI